MLLGLDKGCIIDLGKNIRNEENIMRKILKILQSRLFITALLMFIQVVILVVTLGFLANFSVYYILTMITAVLVVMDIANDSMNPSFKLPWALLVMALPIIGAPLYILFAKSKQSRRISNRFKNYRTLMRNTLPNPDDPISEIEAEEPELARQLKYVEKTAYAPVYRNTEAVYFSSGEEYFDAILKEISKAEHFIFLEYFILEEGKMFNSILDILKEKSDAGVNVRIMYDDIGSISKLPNHYDRYLKSLGFEVSVFNRMKPSLDAFLNYRDHRKILVVDGNVGFTGGINLADEYINEVERFGHWKDTGVMLKGQAVIKLTEIFLQLWHFSREETKIDYKEYLGDLSCPSDGYIQPFADGPSTDDLTVELCYMGLINCATDHFYATTPYLILDNEMTTALCHAARSGVDVRIITPHIPDKKTVMAVTRSNYRSLLMSGVRIFEYTPGFIHAKNVSMDGKVAIVGTANFDFRSLYLHFENCVLFYKSKCVSEVEHDFLETQEKSMEITLDQIKEKGALYGLLQAILKVFSPLM